MTFLFQLVSIMLGCSYRFNFLWFVVSAYDFRARHFDEFAGIDGSLLWHLDHFRDKFAGGRNALAKCLDGDAVNGAFEGMPNAAFILVHGFIAVVDAQFPQKNCARLGGGEIMELPTFPSLLSSFGSTNNWIGPGVS